MINIDKSKFEEIIKEDKLNVCIFTYDQCSSCDRYLEELKKYSTSQFYMINIGMDIDYYIKSHKIGIVPNTRVYKSGKYIWVKSGVLYETQMEKLYSILKG